MNVPDTQQPVVQLSDEDLATVRKEGKKRDEMHPHSRNWNMAREQTNILGLKGELAFAKHYGIAPDLELRPEGDGGIDFHIAIDDTEATVDVKTSKHTDSPHLLVRAARETHPDLYVLTATDGPEVALLGMLPADMVVARDPVEWPYDHRNHRFTVDELLPLPPVEAVAPVEHEDESDAEEAEV